MPSSFLSRVRRTILKIPRGHTMSYGGVALASGLPNGARAVVRALHTLDDVPWWRVRRANGSFAPQVMPMQEVLLRQEGWKPAKKKPRAKKSAPSSEPARAAKKAVAKIQAAGKAVAKLRPAKTPSKKSASKRKKE